MTTSLPLARRLRLAVGAAIRLGPGGPSLLRARRRALAAARRRFYPIRPPLESSEHVALLSQRPPDDAFITGNGLAARCRYVINYDALTVNEDVDNDWWFCKADFIEYFFTQHAPDEGFVLFTHNSDRPVDGRLRRFARSRRLVAWFAANLDLRHPKVHPFPLGIANPRWRHGEGAVLKRVQQAALSKSSLFDASYEVSTYPPARDYCREQTGIAPAPRREFEEYLRGLASSYFCIAPRGHGIDTHRLWEALYLRTVPIVTRSLLSEQHGDLPMVVIDDWSNFRSIEFSPQLYERVWGDWSPDALSLDRYLERVEAVLAGAPPAPGARLSVARGSG